MSQALQTATRATVTGLVDAHTHAVWAGDRVHEFAMKVSQDDGNFFSMFLFVFLSFLLSFLFFSSLFHSCFSFIVSFLFCGGWGTVGIFL